MTARTPKVEYVYQENPKPRHVCNNHLLWELEGNLGDVVKLDCGHYWHMHWQYGGLYISPGWGRVRFWNVRSLWKILRS